MSIYICDGWDATVLVVVVGSSKANGCHRDKHRELMVEQAQRETSAVFVQLLFQYVHFPPLLSFCPNILRVRHYLHVSPALFQTLFTDPLFYYFKRSLYSVDV